MAAFVLGLFLAFGVQALPASLIKGFVINKKKAVSLFSIVDLMSAWSTIRIDDPDARAVMLSSVNDFDFALFYLPGSKAYIVFCSPVASTKIDLVVDGVKRSEQLAVCYVQTTEADEEGEGAPNSPKDRLPTSPFGLIFQVPNNSNCEISFENAGDTEKCRVKLTRAQGYWTGSFRVE